MTAVDTIDLNAAPDFILRDGGELIVHTIACGGGGEARRRVVSSLPQPASSPSPSTLSWTSTT